MERLKKIKSFEKYTFVQLTFFVAYVLDNNEFEEKRDLLDKIDKARLANYTQLQEDILKRQKTVYNMFTNINATLLVPYLNDWNLNISNFDHHCLDLRIQRKVDTVDDAEILMEFFSFQNTVKNLYNSSNQSVDLSFPEATSIQELVSKTTLITKTVPTQTLLTKQDSGRTEPIEPVKLLPPVIKLSTASTIRATRIHTKQAWHEIFFSKVKQFNYNFIIRIGIFLLASILLGLLLILESSVPEGKVIITVSKMDSIVTHVLEHTNKSYIKEYFLQIFLLLLVCILLIVVAFYYFRKSKSNTKSLKSHNRKQAGKDNAFHWRKSHDKNSRNRFPSGKYRLLKDDSMETLNKNFSNPSCIGDSKISTIQQDSQAFESKYKQNQTEMLKMDAMLISSDSIMWS